MTSWMIRKTDQDTLIHYGVKGMKWGVRKDIIKSGIKRTATKARDYGYKQVGVSNFDELTDKLKTMLKDPKGVALLAALVVLPDPLVLGGIAAYKAIQASGKLKKKAIDHSYTGSFTYCNLNTLAHYGVKGMKWGVRRTPEQLGHKRKAGDIENVGAKDLRYYSVATERVKQYAKSLGLSLADLGGTMAVVSVAPTPAVMSLAYAYLARQYAKAVGINRESFNSNEKYMDKDGLPEKLKDLRKKSFKTSMEEDALNVNKGSKTGRTNNCMCCVAALEMRQRGYDVVARRRTAGFPTSEYSNWFNNFEMKLAGTKTNKMMGKERKEKIEASYKDLTKKLESYPEGARGYVAFTYAGTNSGHTISWEIKNKEAVFYDAQGKTSPDKTLSFSDGLYEYGRLDNLTVKPAITNVVVSRKDEKR